MKFITYKKVIKKILFISKHFFYPNYFGFIKGHNYITGEDFLKLNLLVGQKNNKLVKEFENKFANLIGPGKCLSYASARMGFYELMKGIEIVKGDEIILLGFTCSVMANAIMKMNAIPIYSDLDENTYGSNYKSIKRCITNKTKIIVAQHSFGIPCEIEQISKIAKENNIFLIEDCALSLESEINGVKVGNFGDASIFSTDHTKPINTITGGIVFTKDLNLIKKLTKSKKFIPELSYKKQVAILNQIKIEKTFCNPKNYGKYYLIKLFTNFLKILFKLEEPFLNEDFSTKFNVTYPYPAKMPPFLAYLGILEIKKWNQTKKTRISAFNKFKELVKPYNLELPSSYFNKELSIVPLRLIFKSKNAKTFKVQMKKFLDTDSFWFKKPLIGSKEPLENFKYRLNSCPKSENIGEKIINIPCNLDENDLEILYANLSRILKRLSKK